MPEFKLPDVGEGLTEAEIVSWRVAAGDTVEINDVIVEIETAKSLVELPSPYAGVVGDLLVAEGDTVEVGTAIIRIGEEAAAPAPSAAPEPELDLSNPAASGGGEGESLVGRNKADRPALRRARRGSASPVTEAGAATQMQLQGAFSPGGAQSDEVAPAEESPVPARSAVPESRPAEALVPDRSRADVRVLAKPPVRKLAKDLGVDLASLRATGPDGSVSRADVESASSSVVGEGRQARLETSSPSRETREPIKGVRKMMGQAMVDSAFTAPHVTEWVTVDVTATTELVARLRQRRELRDVKVSPLLVLARAVCLAVRRTPIVNSSWDGAAGEVVLKSYVNLGIAAATPRGLVVPNVKDAQALALPELAGALNELTATAREGRTQPAEMADGTITITNVGPFGVDAGTPIINPGESAIVCFGAVKRQPWVVTDAVGAESIEIRDVCTFALSFDHRHVDGESGSRFLADVAGIMSDPGTALLF